MRFHDQPLRGHSLAEKAYIAIRSMIKSGELKPNMPLREVALAESLNISRTPIRQALHRLESEELAIFIPRSGLVVAALDRQRVMELYSFLEALESMAARYMAQYATEEEIAILLDLSRREEDVLDDAQALSSLNAKFHTTLYRGARNRYLLKTVLSIRDQIFLLGKTTLGNPGRSSQAMKEHRAIVQSIQARSPDAAEAAMRTHIRSAMIERLKLLEQDESNEAV